MAVVKSIVETVDGKKFELEHEDTVSDDVLSKYVQQVAYPQARAKESEDPFDFIKDNIAVSLSEMGERGIADSLVLGPQQFFGQELRRLTANYHDVGMLVEEKYGKEEGKEERLRELQSKKNQAMAGVNKYDEISTNMADSLTDTLTALEQDRFVQQDNFFAQLAVDVNRAISGTLPAIGVGLVTKRPDITTGLIFNQSLVEGKKDVEATLKKDYDDMNAEEKQATADVSTSYALFTAALQRYLLPLYGLGKNGANQFLAGKLGIPAGTFKRKIVDVASAGLGETSEELSQKAFLDVFSKFRYDDERELVTKEKLNEYAYEGLVALISGGGMRVGSDAITALGKMKMPTPKTEEVAESERTGLKKYKVKYTQTTKEINQDDLVTEGEREFEAKDLDDAKKIVEGSTGKLPGVDAESIVIEEVQPTVDPLDDTTLSNQEKIQAYYESLTDEELERMIEEEKTAAFSLEQFKSLKDEVTKPDVYEAELAQEQKSYERTKKNAERAKAVLEARKQKPVVDQEPITEVTKIQQELAELADVFAAEMETKGSAPEIRKQIQAKEAELKVAEEAQAKARQEARDAEVKAETDRILKEQKERIAQGKPLFEDFGVFSDVDLETTDLTPEQKAEIIELRKEAQAEAKKILQSLEDPTGQIDTEVIKRGLDALEDPTGAVDTQAVAEGLEALRQISEEGTVGATTEQKQLFNKIREIERRQAEVLGREYIPRTDSSIVREIERTIVRSPIQRGASGALFVGATRYMKPTSVRTAQAVRDWKKNPNLADSSQTKKAISELKRPDNKDVISMVRELLGLYDIGNGRVRVYRGAQEDSDVKVLSGWSLNPEIASDFQEQARDFGEGEITVATIPIKDVLYKDNTLFDDDAVFQEQELIFDTVENLVIEKQTTDNIKDTFTPKIKEEEAIIKSYGMMPAQQVFDEEGMYDPRLTEEDPFPPIEEHGEVADETVDGESLGDAPVVGASVNLPNAPQISRKDFKGKKGFFFFSDRTRVGNYTGLFPEDGIKIKLQGGPAYAFIQKNLDKLAGWAFTSENIFSKFLDKVKATDGIGFITLYKKENLRANGTFLKAYVAEVKAAIKAGRLTTKQFLEAANTAREQVVNLKSTNAKTGKVTFTVPREGKGYKLFSKPFKSIDTFEKAMELVGFEPRGKMFDVRDKVITRAGRRIKVPGELSGGRLASISNTSKGLPDVIKMIDLFSDPALDGRDRGDVIGAVQFDQEQTSSTTAQKLGTEEHLSYPLVIKGKGIGAFSDPTNILDVVQINKRRNQALRSAETSMPTGTVGATDQQGKTDAQRSVIDTAVADAQKLAQKLDVKIVADNTINRPAQYNYETQTIQYNPQLLASRGKEFSKAAMREEVIHAAMHKVIMKRNPKLSAKAAFEKAMSSIGSDLTQEQKDLMSEVYGELGTDLNYGAEYTRFAVQHILDGKTTEGTLFGGKAYEKLKSLIKSVQSYVGRIMGPELKTNEEAAFIIADTIRLLRSVDPDAKPAQQKFVNQAESILSGADALDSFGDNPYDNSLETKKKRESERARRNRSTILMTASSFFYRVHPKIRNVLSNYFTKIERQQTEAFKQINNFQTKIRGIKNEKDKARLKQLLYSTPDIRTAEGKKTVEQRDALLRKYNIYNDFKLLVQPLLDLVRDKAIISGQPVKYLFEFFPRAVKDLEGLLNYYGKDIRRDFESMMDKIDDDRRKKNQLPMNADERAAEFRNYMLNEIYKSNLSTERIPSFLKKRGKGMLSLEELQFYEDPEVSLGGYVNTIIIETAKAELLGVGALRREQMTMLDGQSTYQVDLRNQNGTLSALVTELNNRGELSRKQLGDLFFGLDQLFGPATKNEHQAAEFGRTFSYGSLLVDPTTTLSQLYDLAFIALDNRILDVAKTIFSKKDFTLLDAGIDPKLMSAEFSSDNNGAGLRMDKVVKGMLTLSGFRRLDQLMKETNLTVNYNRFKKLSKLSPNSNKFKKFQSEVQFMLGKDDAERTISDLRNGVYDSPYVRELVVRKLLETQPVNPFEMPMAIRKNPNLRMLYTMKSFIFKQVNLVNDRMVSVILSKTASNDEKKRAIALLIKLIFTFMMAGIPVDFIKDMMAGRDVYPEDYVENAFFRLIGLSKYNLYEAQKVGFINALGLAYLVPVPIAQAGQIGLSLQQNLGKAFEGEFGGTEAAKIIRDIMPLDSVWYYRYGPGGIEAPGVESQRKRRERELKESSSIVDKLLQFTTDRDIGRVPMIEGNRPIGIDINELSDIIPYLRNR